jgi:hypothetical protein
MRAFRFLCLLILLLTGCTLQAGTTILPTAEISNSPQPEAERLPHLEPWTETRAASLIDALINEDQRLSGSDSNLHQAVLTALQEALWLFPESPESRGWRWMQVKLWAKDGASYAAQPAGALIAEALQSEAVALDQLPQWLEAIEPAGTYTLTTSIDNIGGKPLHLLEFQIVGQPALFVIHGKAGAAQVSLLASGREFQSSPGVQTRLEWHDLTGDGQAEAWIITFDPNARIQMASLSLYDLSSGTAQRVTFLPELPMLPNASWQILEHAGQPDGLRVVLRLDGGSALCEYLLPVEYHLVEGEFRRTWIEKPALSPLLTAGFSEAQANLCLDLSVDWLRANANRDEGVSLSLLEALMPGFPYGADATLYVGLYPPDEPDRARFELGLNYALRQDLAGMERWMAAVSETPAFEGSPWQAQAQAFLDASRAEGGLRGACLASGVCLGTGRLDLNQLVRLMQEADWQDPAAFLRQMGVAMVANGRQDFNLDGRSETWWLESTGGAVDTFRILAQIQGQPWLGRLSLPAGAGEMEIESLDALLAQPVYRLRHGASEVIFVYAQADPAQAPGVQALEQYRTRTIQSVYTTLLRDGLAAGGSPSLADLQASPYFNCDQPSEICQPSALLAYLLALSLELSGDLDSAAAAYQRVVENFPGSSYAILATARLEP